MKAKQKEPILGVTESLISAVFHPIVTLSAPAGHLPLEGKAAIREYHLLNRRRSHPCEPIRSPSIVIPSEAEGSLLHCRHMHTCALTQTTPWCFLFRLSLTHDLPLCKKAPSTSWIHPAPSARPFSKGLLVSYITPIVPKHATYLPDENPSAFAYRHPERTKTLYVWKSPSQNKWGLSRRI